MTLHNYIVALGSVTNIYEKERWRRVGPKFSNYYEWKPLRLEINWNQRLQLQFAVSGPFSVKVLHLIRISTIHSHSHIRTVDAKVLLKLLFEMWHTTRHTPFTVVVELAPLLCNSNLVRYTCRLSSYKAATIVATRYYFYVRLKS